jgi:CRISPR-associated protein Cmr3
MTANNSPGWVGVRLDPLDTLFFRDGRPFSAAIRVSGGLPTPQPLAGALRTALLGRSGFRFDEFARHRKKMTLPDALARCGAPPWIKTARFRGPWLALARGASAVEPLLPLPAILSRGREQDAWSWAWPRQSGNFPGWRDPDRLLPLWRRVDADAKAASVLLTLTGLAAFLEGRDPPGEECYRIDELYGFDNRIGIGIDMHALTSAEGELYGIRLLALKDKVRGARLCLYAEMCLGADAEQRPWFDGTPVPFGGEGRCVRAFEINPCTWPTADPTRPRGLWYLASPTFLPVRQASRRSLPELPGLKAAASGAGFAISGWDVAANGPRPTRFAVPAGAVYFVEGQATAGNFVSGDDTQTTDELLAEGWGFALQGKWEDQS